MNLQPSKVYMMSGCSGNGYESFTVVAFIHVSVILDYFLSMTELARLCLEL
jgi:hypothetical protein